MNDPFDNAKDDKAILEKFTSIRDKNCSYCGHTFADHNVQYQGYWRCRKEKHCVCVMFKDGKFPIKVEAWHLTLKSR